MCVNYKPIQRKILRDVFGVEPPPEEWPEETWPNYRAPIIRADAGQRAATVATFSFLPADRNPRNLRTENIKSETVGERSNFGHYWRAGRLCLVPMESFFEPNYEADPNKSIRHRIWLKDEPTFAVAGLWRDWPDGLISFGFFTVDASQHPIMSRMHAPGKEKRSIVILPRAQWDDWLTCRDSEVARSFFKLYPADLMATEPAPAPPRARKQSPKAKVKHQ